MFNERGEIIGLVSRSLRAEGSHPGMAYPVHFAMARDIDQFMPNNDELNPAFRALTAADFDVIRLGWR